MQNGRPYARKGETEMADESDCGAPEAEREDPPGGLARVRRILYSGEKKILAAGCCFAATAAFRGTPEEEEAPLSLIVKGSPSFA